MPAPEAMVLGAKIGRKFYFKMPVLIYSLKKKDNKGSKITWCVNPLPVIPPTLTGSL